MNEERDRAGFDAVEWSREAKKTVSEGLVEGANPGEQLEDAASRLGGRIVPAPSEEMRPDPEESAGDGRGSDSD